MTKQRMIGEVEERIRRLQEDAIVSKLTTGNYIHLVGNAGQLSHLQNNSKLVQSVSA